MLLKENAKTFTDIGSHWAKDSIGFVTEREIFLGTGSNVFSPDSGMTRAMFATVIGRLYERSYGGIDTMSTHAFTDCDYDDYYGKYVDWAARRISPIGGICCTEQGDHPSGNGGDFLPLRRFPRLLPDDMDTALIISRRRQHFKLCEECALYCQSTASSRDLTAEALSLRVLAARAEVATIIQRFVESVLT